jgi:hypothetical protein
LFNQHDLFQEEKFPLSEEPFFLARNKNPYAENQLNYKENPFPKMFLNIFFLFPKG